MLPIGEIKNAGSTAMSQAIRWRLDSAGSPVTYSHVTVAAGAGDGSSQLACSELSQGRFRLPASLGTSAEDLDVLYPSGSFWVVKVRATESSGAFTETDTLLRVPTGGRASVIGGVVLDLRSPLVQRFATRTAERPPALAAHTLALTTLAESIESAPVLRVIHAFLPSRLNLTV